MDNKPLIQATLKSLVDQTSLQLEAVPVKKGVYSIEYIPKVRGRHHLLISVDGQPITGSPFSVFVRMPPTKLDKPAREIRNIDPWYLAINSSEEIIVSDDEQRYHDTEQERRKITQHQQIQVWVQGVYVV